MSSYTITIAADDPSRAITTLKTDHHRRQFQLHCPATMPNDENIIVVGDLEETNPEAEATHPTRVRRHRLRKRSSASSPTSVAPVA